MIHLNNISFAYDNQVVFKDLNLKISQGEATLITGINGSGKTTLLRLMAGVLFPQRGTVTYADNLGPDPGGKIGFISDQMRLYENMTLGQAAAFHARIHHLEFKDCEFMTKARLHMDKRINQLSAGQKLIFHLGLILNTQPEILLIDEVIHSMDVYLREMFLNHLVEAIGERNVTLVMVNLNFHDIEKIPQRIILLKDGRVAVDESVEGLKDKVKRVVTTEEITDVPILCQRQFADATEFYIYPFSQEIGDKVKGKIEDLNLHDIIKAFIGGEYA